VCRDCDRGNQYCGPECGGRAKARRRREATRRYQATPRGQLKHRERQRRFRKRQRQRARERESVTHPGSDEGVGKSTVEAAPQRERQTDETQKQDNPTSRDPGPTSLEGSRTTSGSKSVATKGARQEGQRPCCICDRWCGPYVRTYRLALSGRRRGALWRTRGSPGG
jgi:hypothetical protein